MRSPRLIVEGELQEDYDRLAAGWRAKYGGDGQDLESLLSRVIQADWLLRRTELWNLDAQAKAMETHPLDWTAEQHHKLELFGRYKTGAERSFYRAYGALRGLRKDEVKEALDLEIWRKNMAREAREIMKEAHEEQARATETKAQEKAAAERAPKRAEDLFRGQHHPKKAAKVVPLEQWIEVRVEEGVTVTHLFPSNAQLIREGQAMRPPPTMVHRRLYFPDGIPAEYAWTARSRPELFAVGGAGVQRMEVNTWLQVIAREAEDARGHVGPTGVGNLPRAKQRGECECAVCVGNAEILERRAAEG